MQVTYLYLFYSLPQHDMDASMSPVVAAKKHKASGWDEVSRQFSLYNT